MKSIQDIDKNFIVNTSLRKDRVRIFDVCEKPFEVFGLIKPQDAEDKFRRMPENVAKTVSEGVEYLHTDTAGGRVRFATDSDYIAIHAELPRIGKMPHFALTGSAGFDLYAEENGEQKYVKTFVPDFEIENTLESEYRTDEKKMREYTINFPLYSEVKKLYVILDENAEVKACRSYRYTAPVVYYGSSITQGGCASRPGMAYQSIISRRFDCDYINLGFSGSAKGEKEIAEYIAELDMGVFVYDYDHNAPSTEHLKNTHEAMFKIIRSANPTLPIICLSRPVQDADADERRAVVMQTIDNAVAEGDENVYFIDGTDTMRELGAGDSVSVDGCHPNDLGFMCMANIISKTLKDVL